MIARYAIFSGTLKPGAADAMRAFVEDRLAPLWRRFARAEEVRILYGVEQDPEGPTIPLILAIGYADTEAMRAALASPARHEAKAILPELYERFFEEVTIYHYVMDVASLAPLRD